MKIGRMVIALLGVALVFFGVRWVLQGASILTSGGAMMVGHSEWIPIGSVALIVGLGAVASAFFWKKRSPRP